MTLDVENFSKYSGAARVQYSMDDQSVKTDGSKPKTLFGRLWDWMTRSKSQRQANTETNKQFISSLKQKYGDSIGELASVGLASHVKKGKPLTGRRIQEVIDKAEKLAAKQPKQELDKAKSAEKKPEAKKPVQPPDPFRESVRGAMGFQYDIFMIDAFMAAKRSGLDQYNLTRSELASIHAYTTSDRFNGYAPINRALRQFKSGDTSLGKLEPVIRAGVSGMKKLPDHKGPVFRQLNDPKGSQRGLSIMSQYKKGAVVSEKAFVSTTYQIPPGSEDGGFPGYSFLIESVHGKNVEKISANPTEKEVLFPPGTSFEVTDRIETSDGNILVKMRELPDEDQK